MTEKKHLIIQRAGSAFVIVESSLDTVIRKGDATQSVKYYRLFKELASQPLLTDEQLKAVSMLSTSRADELKEVWFKRRQDLLTYYLDRITIPFEECEAIIAKEE